MEIETSKAQYCEFLSIVLEKASPSSSEPLLQLPELLCRLLFFSVNFPSAILQVPLRLFNFPTRMVLCRHSETFLI